MQRTADPTFLSFLLGGWGGGGGGGVRTMGEWRHKRRRSLFWLWICLHWNAPYMYTYKHKWKKKQGGLLLKAFENFFSSFLMQIPVMKCKHALQTACICIQYLISKAKSRGRGSGGGGGGSLAGPYFNSK